MIHYDSQDSAPPNDIPESPREALPLIADAPKVAIICGEREHQPLIERVAAVLRAVGCPSHMLVVPAVWLQSNGPQFAAQAQAAQWGAVIVASRGSRLASLLASFVTAPVILLPQSRQPAHPGAMFRITSSLLSGEDSSSDAVAPFAIVPPGQVRQAALLAARIAAVASVPLAANIARFERLWIEAHAPLTLVASTENPAAPKSESASPSAKSIAPPAAPQSTLPASAPATQSDGLADSELNDWFNKAGFETIPAPSMPPAQQPSSPTEKFDIRPVDFTQQLTGVPLHTEAASPPDAPPAIIRARKLGRESVNPEMPQIELIEDVVDCLLEGGVVALPTDTVYGLAVDATNPAAVQRLYELKQRPSGKAITLLVDSPRQLASIACNITVELRRLMEAYWPGPLTIIFEKRGASFAHISADQTIGVRLPDHAIPLSIIQALARPLACTSANLAGEPDAMNAQTIDDVFGNGIDCLLDAGPLRPSPSSTVLDATKTPYRILRQGSITQAQLAAIVGDKVESR